MSVTPKELRRLADEWAEQFADGGMPKPMPLTMYPDAWLRARADLIEQKEAEAEAARRAADDTWLRGVCERQGVDANTVLRDTIRQEVRYHYMWRSPLEWPAGGTYEADTPRDFQDEIVGQRATSTVNMTVVGEHPGARRRVSTEYGTLSELGFVDESPWIFASAESSQ
jgi:hypothetical protein